MKTLPLLIDFLNALLPEQNKIVDLSFKNTEQLGFNDLDRKAVYDIYCENDKGEKFIVELQKAKQNFFKERTIFYSTFPIREQGEKGFWDFNLKVHRDLKNTVDTAFGQGLTEGEIRGKIEGKMETARQLKKLGVDIDIIKRSTGLSDSDISKL